jgi:hypothetical protein
LYTYTVTGSLPPGLALTPVTATKTATLSGTPTTPGIYSFTITATDVNGCQVSQAYSMLAGPPGSNIPTLSGWAMALLVGLLALAGVAALRRMT